jgi:hypothetical protein
MKDRLVIPAMIALGLLMVSLASVWPQGYGARSPGPFGHTPIQQTPEMQAAMARDAAALQRKRQSQAASAAVAAGLRKAH